MQSAIIAASSDADDPPWTTPWKPATLRRSLPHIHDQPMPPSTRPIRRHRLLQLLALCGWLLLVLAPITPTTAMTGGGAAPTPAQAAPHCQPHANPAGCENDPAPDTTLHHACQCPAMSGAMLQAAGGCDRVAHAAPQRLRPMHSSAAFPMMPSEPPLRPPSA